MKILGYINILTFLCLSSAASLAQDSTFLSGPAVHDFGIGLKERESVSAASVSVVSGDEIRSSGQQQVMKALYGRLPGLLLIQDVSSPWHSSDTPGIYVRGTGSTSGASVLVLVDGIRRDPSTVNVDEVEKVIVMKDAAVLALYGVRGADGVINIVTRRGGEDRLKINGGYDVSLMPPFRVPEMASPGRYASAYNEALMNDGLSPYWSDSDIRALSSGSSTVIPTVDWKKEMLRKFAYNHDVWASFDGSGKNMKYYLYADYHGNKGLFNGTSRNSGYSTQSEYDALKIRANLDLNITKSTFFRANLMGSLAQHSAPYEGLDLTGMYTAPSAGIPVEHDGRYVATRLFSNPVAEKMGRGYSTVFQRMLAVDLSLVQDLSVLTDGLSAHVRVAYDNSADIYDNLTRSYSWYEAYPVRDASGNISDYSYTEYGTDSELQFASGLNTQYMQTVVRAGLDYSRTFGAHDVGACFLFNRDKLRYSGANDVSVHHDYILNASWTGWGKYHLSAVMSASASAKLPSGDKFRFYPSVAASWLISGEDFLKDAHGVDLLKLRASYGLVGQDGFLSYDMDRKFSGSTIKWFSFNGTGSSAGLGEGNLPSSGVAPELDHKVNVGLDARFLGEVDFSFDFFRNRRTNIRNSLAGSISSVLGTGVGDVFTGEVLNTGFEAAVSWHRTAGIFSWNIGANVSFAKNRILHYEEENHPYAYMFRQGCAVGAFYGLESDGFYSEADFGADGRLLPSLPVNTFVQDLRPGDVKYKDLNGDRKIDSYDFKYHDKSLFPQVWYGIQLGFSVAGAGFNAVFSGAADYIVETALPSIYQPLYSGNKNVSEHYLNNCWSADRQDARYPRLTASDHKGNYLRSDLWTDKGGFFKLRELEVYYRLPVYKVGKMNMSMMKFFLRGTNLFSVDSVKIMDPEYISMGYPQLRTWTVGFTFTFK